MPESDSSSLLLKTATPELYRRNAFRLTGLSVTATAREVARQADKLKMLADLGGQAAQQLAVIPGMEAPTLEEIREAAQRLKDVEARALDEFFWFWPQNWEEPEADEAFVAIKRHDLDSAFAIWANREVETECLKDNVIASHNIALVLHMRAIEWALSDFAQPLPASRAGKVQELWKDAFDRWEWLADDDRLWNAFKTRIRQVNDPALTSGLARRLRGELPQALDKINAELALSYAQQARRVEAQWHVRFLRSTHEGQADADATLDMVLAPIRARLESAIESTWESTRKEKRSGITQAMKLLDAADPMLAILGIFYEEDSLERCQVQDQVAKAVLGCAVDGYVTANQALQNQSPPVGHALDPKQVVNEAFLRALQRAEALATDPDLVQRIAQNIQTALGNQQFDTKIKPILEQLSAIQKSTHAAPAERLKRLKDEIIPKVNALLQPGILDDDGRRMLGNSLAVVCRDIALSANNVFQQPVIGMEALTLAARYARDPELLAKLKQDDLVMSQNISQGQPTPAQSPNKGCLRILWGPWGLIILGIVAAIILNDAPKYPKTSNPSPYLSSVPTLPLPEIPVYRPIEPLRLTPLPSIPELKPLEVKPLAPPDKEGWHTWRNRVLKEITAKMLSFDGKNVVLETTDGKTHTYPLSGLSDESQLLAWRLLGRGSEAPGTTAPTPQTLPLTGLFRGPATSGGSSGPLTIRTRAGSGNFYVKLVERYTGAERLVIFVRDGATAHDIDVPAGTYEVRYASGSTWYGEQHLFGTETSYSKAESDFVFGNDRGYTVELYKQAGGNLQTSPINKNNF